MSDLNALASECRRIADEHGFTEASIGEDLMLMVTELAEAMEEHRAGRRPNEVSEGHELFRNPLDLDGKPRKPVGIPSELADVIIRILHFSGKHGIDIERAVVEKMAYNATRSFKHGGKTL